MERKKHKDECSYLLSDLSMMFAAHACRRIWDQHDHNNNNSSLFFCYYCVSLLIFLNMNNHTVSELRRSNSSVKTRNKMYKEEKIGISDTN
jgi:hypothetical protein